MSSEYFKAIYVRLQRTDPHYLLLLYQQLSQK